MQQPLIELGEEDGDADAVGSEGVGVGVGDLPDQPSGPDDVQAFFDRCIERIPTPFTPEGRDGGYWWGYGTRCRS